MSGEISVTATVSKEWKRRMLLIAAVVAAMGGWFLFDGLVAYPRQNQRAAAYAELVKRFGKGTAEFEEAWANLRNERGWSAKKPEKTYSQGDIRFQLVLGIAGLLVAAGVIVHLYRGLGTTTQLQNGMIILPNGRRIPLDKVRALSKRRWERMGIADLAYEREDGKIEKFLLDDYKYVGVDQILARIEEILPPEAQGKANQEAEAKPEKQPPPVA